MNNCFLLGIDYGSKKTGLAIGQSVTRNSRPLKVIYSNYIDEIKKLSTNGILKNSHWISRI